MKEHTSSIEAEKIYKALEPRLDDFRDKLINGKYNAATWLAFKIGFVSDIDAALRVIKVKRTPIKKVNVSELRVKDVGLDIDLEAR